MGLDMYLFAGDDRREIGYWRKANAIHAWFVRVVQAGVDRCQVSPVSREQLSLLRTTCQEVLTKSETRDGKVCVGERSKGGGVWEKRLEPGKVVTNPEVAESLLPAQEGFFFGGTDYDGSYLADLRETVVIIDRALSDEFKDEQIFYHSSW